MTLDKAMHPPKPLDTFSAPQGIDDRIVPIPAEKTCLLYGPELRISFVKEQRTEVLHGHDIIAGRDKTTCQLHLSSPAASLRHARFELKNTTWYLSDLNSINGVLLNGCRLKRDQLYYLLPNDEIVFGDEKIIFDCQKIELPAPPPLPVRPSPPVAPPPPPLYPAIYPDFGMLRLTGLILCYHQNWGVRTLFDRTDPLILHDSAGNQVLLHYGDVDTRYGIAVFPDKTPCPKPYAVFRYCVGKNSTWSLMDYSTLDGTRINGAPLVPYKEYPLTAGDMIRFGANEPYTFGSRTIANRYEIVRLLEHGPYVKTYLVEHLRLHKTFVAKVMDKTDSNCPDAMRKCFLETINLTKPLQHPMIPRMVDLIEDAQSITSVTEYIQGDNLLKILEKNGPFSAAAVIDMGLQMCNVLEYLHSMTPRRIHRDVKPSNILLRPDGQLMLIDFEIMICIKPDGMPADFLFGTKGYAAPEQYQTTKLTPATDIYALGVTLYQLVTGQDPAYPPYECLPIRQINPDLPKDLEQILLKCTQRDHKNRYQTCAELQADLQKAKNPKPSFHWFHR